MKYKVAMASKNREYSFKGRDGSDVSMIEYNIGVMDEAGTQTITKLSRSAKKDEPKVGDELIGEITNSEKFGSEFKEERTGGAGGGRSFGKSMEERMEIMRQSAVERAVEYQTMKGNFLVKLFELNLASDKQLVEHAKTLTGTHLLNIAAFITVFDKGEWTPSITADEVQKIMTTKVEVEAEKPVVKDEEKPPFDQPQEDVDPSEIPDTVGKKLPF